MKELNTGSGGEKEIAQSGYQEEDLEKAELHLQYCLTFITLMLLELLERRGKGWNQTVDYHGIGYLEIRYHQGTGGEQVEDRLAKQLP